jgi:hypothetical protein
MFARIASLSLFFIISAATTHAATLLTPSMNVTNVDNTLDCRIVNGGDKSITVLIEMVNASGVVILDDQKDVPPGGAQSIDLTDTDESASCRFSGKFGKKAVRGSIQVLDGSLRTISIAPAE